MMSETPPSNILSSPPIAAIKIPSFATKRSIASIPAINAGPVRPATPIRNKAVDKDVISKDKDFAVSILGATLRFSRRPISAPMPTIIAARIAAFPRVVLEISLE